MYFLQHRDLSGKDLRKIPVTGALIDQKLKTLPSHQKWLYNMLSIGELDGRDFGCGCFPKTRLYNSYEEFCNRQRLRSVVDNSTFLLNLKLVQRIFFGNETITGLANFSSADSDNQKYPCIQFMAEDSQGLSILCSLIFKPAGMGEYHRYKRQIESIAIDGICEKVEQTDDKPEQTEGELILEMEAVDG